MFAGKIINNTEQRAVLHTALRANAGQQIFVDGVDIVPEVQQTQQKWLNLLHQSPAVNGEVTPVKRSPILLASGLAVHFSAPKLSPKPYVPIGIKFKLPLCC